jgi:hypothetical protein
MATLVYHLGVDGEELREFLGRGDALRLLRLAAPRGQGRRGSYRSCSIVLGRES